MSAPCAGLYERDSNSLEQCFGAETSRPEYKNRLPSIQTAIKFRQYNVHCVVLNQQYQDQVLDIHG